MKFTITFLALAVGMFLASSAQARNDSKMTSFTVCADPGNMPLSNDKGQGFENKIAQVLGNALGTGVNFQWWPSMGHGMMRKTLGAGLCDAWLDMTPDTEGAITTVPLYRTTYVLVSRADEHLHIKSLDDPLLKKLKLGVFELSAVREALTEHAVYNTQVHYLSYDGNLNPKDQPSYQVQQVADGELDAAAIWGPMAGYYKTIKHEPLVLQPLNLMSNDIPLQFDMALALPKAHPELKARLEAAMRQSRSAIRHVLVDYGVPLVACKKCVISGDIAAHGPYAKQATPTLTASDSGQKSASASSVDGVTLAELKTWLAQGADPSHELQDAIIADDLVRVRYLLDHGADVNNVDNGGYPALSNATRFGFNDVATYLIKHKAKVDQRDSGGWTPLMYAAWDDDATLVEKLSAHGANLEATDPKGLTSLAIAAQNGKSKAEAALIRAGADVNAPVAGGGYTPLMLAALSGSDATTRLLIAHGAQVNARNPGGVTPLMIAAAHNHPQVAALLLQHGADAALRTQDGRTALSIARRMGNSVIVKLLEAHGKPADKSA